MRGAARVGREHESSREVGRNKREGVAILSLGRELDVDLPKRRSARELLSRPGTLTCSECGRAGANSLQSVGWTALIEDTEAGRGSFSPIGAVVRYLRHCCCGAQYFSSLH